MSFSLPLNPALQNLPTYQPGRPIEEVARQYNLDPREIIKLASNENPLGPSPQALEAMRSVLSQLHLYPDGNAFYLKRRLADKLGVDVENIVLGNGSNEIIEFIGHALMRPGIDVIVSQYCFAIYPIVAKMFGANLITLPAKKIGHDIPAMARAITPDTRVIFVANPNNPTGTLAREGEIEELVRKAPQHTLVVLDQAYIEFMEETSRAQWLKEISSGAFPNLLLMRTFSKIYGLAGLRLGYGIGHPQLIAALEKVRQPFNINALIQAGALAALDDREHIENTRTNNSAGLNYYYDELRSMNIEFVPSAANFLLLKVGDGQKVFNDLQKRGVITRPMAGYGLPEWLRVSIGAPDENRRCVAELKAVLDRK